MVISANSVWIRLFKVCSILNLRQKNVGGERHHRRPLRSESTDSFWNSFRLGQSKSKSLIDYRELCRKLLAGFSILISRSFLSPLSVPICSSLTGQIVNDSIRVSNCHRATVCQSSRLNESLPQEPCAVYCLSSKSRRILNCWFVAFRLVNGYPQ